MGYSVAAFSMAQPVFGVRNQTSSSVLNHKVIPVDPSAAKIPSLARLRMDQPASLILNRHILHTRVVDQSTIQVCCDPNGKVVVLENNQPMVFEGIPKTMLMQSEVIERAKEKLATCKLVRSNDIQGTVIKFQLDDAKLKGGGLSDGIKVGEKQLKPNTPFVDYPQYSANRAPDGTSISETSAGNQAGAFPDSYYSESFDYDNTKFWDTGKEFIHWVFKQFNLDGWMDSIQKLPTSGALITVSEIIKSHVSIVGQPLWEGLRNADDKIKIQAINEAFLAAERTIQAELFRAQSTGTSFDRTKIEAACQAIRNLKDMGGDLKFTRFKISSAASIQQALGKMRQSQTEAIAMITQGQGVIAQERYDLVDSRLTATSIGTLFFSKLLKTYDPVVAKKINEIGQEGIVFTRQLNTLSHFGNKLSTAQLLQCSFLMGNALFEIGRHVFGSSQGPDVETMLKAFNDTLIVVRQQIHERFDQLENLLAQSHQVIMREFIKLEAQQVNLRLICDRGFNTLSSQIAQMNSSMEAKFAATVKRDIAQSVSCAFKVVSGDRISPAEYLELVRYLNINAGDDDAIAKSELITGRKANAGFSAQEIITTLTHELNTPMYVGYLCQYAQSKGALTLNPSLIVNPLAWMRLADAFMHVRMHVLSAGKTDLETQRNPAIGLKSFEESIESAGINHEVAITQIQRAHLFAHLLDEYAVIAQQLSRVSLNDLKEHISGTRIQPAIDQGLENLDAITRLWQQFVGFAFPYSSAKDPVFSAFTTPNSAIPYRLLSRNVIEQKIRQLSVHDNVQLNELWQSLTDTVGILKAIIAQKQSYIALGQEEINLPFRVMRQKVQKFKEEFYKAPVLPASLLPSNIIDRIELEALCPDNICFHIRVGNEAQVAAWLSDAAHDVNLIEESSGKSLTHLALELGQSGIAELLLSKAPNIYTTDKRGNSLLHAAALGQDATMIRRVGALGVNPFQRNNQGQRAVDLIPDSQAALRAEFSASAANLHTQIRTGNVRKVKTIDVSDRHKYGWAPVPFKIMDGYLMLIGNVNGQKFKLQLWNASTLLPAPGFPEDGIELAHLRPFSTQGRTHFNVSCPKLIGSKLFFQIIDAHSYYGAECNLYSLDIQTQELCHYGSPQHGGGLEAAYWRDNQAVILENNIVKLVNFKTGEEKIITDQITYSQMHIVGDILYMKNQKSQGVYSYFIKDLAQDTPPRILELNTPGFAPPIMDFKRSWAWIYNNNHFEARDFQTNQVQRTLQNLQSSNAQPVMCKIDDTTDRLYMIEHDGTVKVYDLNDNSASLSPIATHTIGIPEGASSCSLLPEGPFLFDWHGPAPHQKCHRIFDLDTGRLLENWAPIQLSAYHTHGYLGMAENKFFRVAWLSDGQASKIEIWEVDGKK